MKGFIPKKLTEEDLSTGYAHCCKKAFGITLGKPDESDSDYSSLSEGEDGEDNDEQLNDEEFSAAEATKFE